MEVKAESRIQSGSIRPVRVSEHADANTNALPVCNARSNLSRNHQHINCRVSARHARTHTIQEPGAFGSGADSATGGSGAGNVT